MTSANSENFYRSFFEYSMDAVLLTAPDGSVFAANRAACEIFGQTEVEICKSARSGLVDASSPALKDLLDQRAQMGKARGELIFIRGDGTRFPGEVSSAQFVDADGEIRTIMIIRDLTDAKRAEEVQAQLLFEANRNAAEVEAILASQDDAILMYDTDMRVRRVNPSFLNIYGFDPVGLKVADIISRVSCRHLDGQPLVLSEQPTPRALRGEKISNVLYMVTRGDGSEGIVETSSRPLYVGSKIIGSVTIWHDVTELKRAEEALKKSSEEIEDLYERAPCGYHSLNVKGLVLRMNQTELEWLGYSRGEIVGKMYFYDLLTPQSQNTFRDNFPRFLESGYVHDLEFELRRKDGTRLPVLLSGTAIRDAAGQLVMSQSTLFDLTERKKMERELERQARIDMLTGLNNRRHFFELAEHELARAARHNEPLSLLMLDLDNFKAVNDTYGHHTGDAALQKLSEVSVQTLREMDILGRLGGEEFAALLPETASEQAMEVAERLRLAVENSVVTLEDGTAFHFTVSIGVTSLERTDARVDALLKRADSALYKAKKGGRNLVCSQHAG